MIRLTSKERKWTFFFILPLYFGFGQLIISFFAVLLSRIFHFDLNLESADAWYNLLYLVFVGTLSIWVYRDYLKKSCENMKGRWLKEIAYACTLGSLKFYIINIVCSLIIVLINPNGSSANQEAVSQMTNIAPVIMFITTVVLAPFVEEIIFRVGLFQFFYKKGRLTAYLISSLMFGLVHILNGLVAGDLTQLFYLLPYGLLGAVLCRFYEKRDTFFAPVMIHALNNLASILLIL